MIPMLENGLENIHGFETDYVKLLYYDIPANHIGKYQSHNYPRLCTILEGEKKVTVDHKRYTYDKSQSLMLPSHSNVLMEINKPTKALVFELNNQLIDQVIEKSNIDLDNISPESARELILNNNKNDISEDLKKLLELGIEKRHQDNFLVDIYAQKLVYNLLNISSASQCLIKGKDNPMLKAADIMKNNIKETITLKDIAQKINMSESNFSQHFKKEMGLSPQKYLNTLKLEESLELLQKNKVTEVSFDLGYDSPSHFIRIFKEKYKITPKQYQLKGLPVKY
ncbi:MAG: AraC family transcriptional regulator [Eubacteriales bacterium]